MSRHPQQSGHLSDQVKLDPQSSDVMSPDALENEDDLNALELFEKEIDKVRPSKPYTQTTAPVFHSAPSAPNSQLSHRNNLASSSTPLEQPPVQWSSMDGIGAAPQWSHGPPQYGPQPLPSSVSLPSPPPPVSHQPLSGPIGLANVHPYVEQQQPQTHTEASADVTENEQEEKQAKASATVKRTAAGKVWHDHTMEEWPEDDHRLFVGDLGPDATDAQLTTAFSKYTSFHMARVVKDKRTSVCRGYGFVSFGNAADMLSAIKEMNGKYVGSRPVKLRQSNWKKRSLTKDKWKRVHALRSISKR